MRCTHYYCQCMRRAELAAMNLTHEAIKLNDNIEVECRQVPAPDPFVRDPEVSGAVQVSEVREPGVLDPDRWDLGSIC